MLDAVGGPVLQSSLDLLAPFGRAVVYGAATGELEQIPVVKLFELRSVTGFNLTARRHANPDQARHEMDEIGDLFAAGQHRHPHIGMTGSGQRPSTCAAGLLQRIHAYVDVSRPSLCVPCAMWERCSAFLLLAVLVAVAHVEGEAVIAEIRDGTVEIFGNPGGLRDLARRGLALSDEQAPTGAHVHLDPGSISLAVESTPLMLARHLGDDPGLCNCSRRTAVRSATRSPSRSCRMKRTSVMAA
ncbi:hypothetical protein [Actinoplanes sp. NBRC 103695]|uniref:Imm32 family immunity protein n=1 Tax=Actinoplanes sp. NBRC 103695 TaxID=3032202 RepID=UPI002556AF52|nr:hypothetical protein [Actinoplanes sp. NBRC 103695]